MSPSSCNDAQSTPPRSPHDERTGQRAPSDEHTHRKSHSEQRSHTESRPRNNPSSFDLEPNPFEQSFSRDPESKSPKSKQHSHSEAGTPKPVLPSLAALSSPSDSYSWSNLTGSLRSGPLSPAMLQGPQQPHQSSNSSMPLSYDPTRSFGRTGLTPSTGLTPLVGGPVSFPPASPNTAAFIASMVTSSSPSQLGSNPATITPNTLNTITGMMNPIQSQQQQQQPSTTIAPAATTSAAAPGITSAVPQQQHFSHMPAQSFQYAQVPPTQQNGYAPTSAANAANAAANGLFLLSQAHQELTKREEAQARAGQGSADATQSRRGAKRKSIDGTAPASTSRGAANKKPRGGTGRGRRGKMSAGSPEDDDDSMDEDEMRAAVEESERTHQANGTKKPETEEEKRRNFLERNRQAALKCRQRKKAWLAQLQAKVEFLTNENDRLTSALVSSREEISRLNALLGASAAGGAQPGNGVGGSQPVSVAVSLPQAGKGIPAQTGPGVAGQSQGPPVSVVTNGRGYGY